jgi:hypothetical protein
MDPAKAGERCGDVGHKPQKAAALSIARSVRALSRLASSSATHDQCPGTGKRRIPGGMPRAIMNTLARWRISRICGIFAQKVDARTSIGALEKGDRAERHRRIRRLRRIAKEHAMRDFANCLKRSFVLAYRIAQSAAATSPSISVRSALTTTNFSMRSTRRTPPSRLCMR